MYKYFYELDINEEFKWESERYRKVGAYDAEDIHTGEIVPISLNDFVEIVT